VSPGVQPLAPVPLERFRSLSVELTGFNGTELDGTGMLREHYGVLTSIVGEPITARLLSRWADIVVQSGGNPSKLAALLQSVVLADPTLGPVARNLAVLWYLGQWNQMPVAWRTLHGANARDLTHVVSAEGYIEGLVWPAIHSHPQGAKQPGYGSWSLPPSTGATGDD
jgi:hypothetical protein